MPGAKPKKRGRPRDEALAMRRREEILDAAAAIFAERGYRSTDVQVVADELKVGKGTIYRYFSSKEALFLAAVDRGMDRLTASVHAEADATEDPLEKLMRATEAYLGFFDECPQIAELLIQERAEFKNRKKPTYFEHRDANVERWRKLFRQLIREGRVRHVPLHKITDVLSDLLYGTMFTNAFAGRRKSLQRQAREVIEIAFLGILSDRERTRFLSQASRSRSHR